jgi:hypothetical protein
VLRHDGIKETAKLHVIQTSAILCSGKMALVLIYRSLDGFHIDAGCGDEGKIASKPGHPDHKPVTVLIHLSRLTIIFVP